MASTGARTLRLLALLQSRRTWSAADLAGRLDVSTRTVRRDVDRLRDLGYPVHSAPGVDGGYQLATGATMPPLVLDDDETVALVVALGDTARTGVGDISQAAVLALAKILRMLPVALRQRAEALAGSTVAATWGPNQAAGGGDVPADGGRALGPSLATLVVLGECCRDGVRVDFGYTSRTGEVTHRRVEPYHLVTLGSRWYLLAFDGDRDDWRTFRVDRLDEPRPLRNTFTRRPLPDDDVARYVRARMGAAVHVHRVELEVTAEPAALRPWLGRRGTLEDLGDGRHRVSLATDRLDWVAFFLSSLRAPFTVLAPEELVDLLRDQANHLRTHVGSD